MQVQFRIMFNKIKLLISQAIGLNDLSKKNDQVVGLKNSFLNNLPEEFKQELIEILDIDNNEINQIRIRLENLIEVNQIYSSIINDPKFMGDFIINKFELSENVFDENQLCQIFNFVEQFNLAHADSWFENFLNINSSKIKPKIFNMLFVNAIYGRMIYINPTRDNNRLIEVFLNNPAIDVNCSEFNGYPPLICAFSPILEDNILPRTFDIGKMLLAHPNIDINMLTCEIDHKNYPLSNVGDAGFGLLHIAVQERDLELIKFLLDQPKIDINLRTYHTEQTALGLAQEGYNKILKCIEESKAKLSDVNINAEDFDFEKEYLESMQNYEAKINYIIDLLKDAGAQ